LRDKLQFPFTDVGDGWLIFDMPQADLGCHPAERPSHDISFYCADIRDSVEQMKSRGVAFVDDIEDHGYGFVTHFDMPGVGKVQLYQPKYAKPRQSDGDHDR
jgi:hypothetical protein